MLVAAAFCPHPPLIVPEVAGAAVTELAGVRNACRVAIGRLLGAHLELIVVVGGGSTTVTYDVSAGGSLAGYGVDIRVGPGEAVLPLSLTIGGWLLERSGGRRPDGAVHFHSIDEKATPADCLSLGSRLGGCAPRVGMIVMGDGSACHDTPERGYVERALDFDATVARALASGDASALARLDIDLADEFLVTGRAAWQVLAGAAGEDRFDAQLLSDTAPYGTEYLVASWHLTSL